MSSASGTGSGAANVDGFLTKPKKTAGGKTFHGRFTCHDVQWAGSGGDRVASFTITADELAAIAANNLLWTDQKVQRGIRPEVHPQPPNELSLAEGYPDTKRYIFNDSNADDMVEKLLSGQQIFFNPLVWNLRPGEFEAHFDQKSRTLYLYGGKIFLPDSHHRQQAIIKATKIWSAAKKDYPKFNGDREFKVEIYFLSREGEGNYFYHKNQLNTPTAKSKAYDLTTDDDLSLLAKRVAEKSQALAHNINRVTDRLAAKNPQVMTLSTLREMMRTFAGHEQVEATELDGLATIAAEFFDMIATVRSEIAQQPLTSRVAIRENYIVDAAVMMHGYAALMKSYSSDLASLGRRKAQETWKEKLSRLHASNSYTFNKWSGDFFAKSNPLWTSVGVVKPSKSGSKLTILNTGAARSECGRVLRQFLAASPAPAKLDFLALR